MLRQIPAWKFFEWKAFYDLEPDEGYRMDWGLAHIVQAIFRDGKPLRDFFLPFGDRPRAVPTIQSVAQQEKLLNAWIFVNNAQQQQKKN